MFTPVSSNQNFPETEKELLKKWYETGIIKKYLSKNKESKKTFSFMDGPITANNPMGVHHAWGRTYKDLWRKFYNLLGYKQKFQNGFDCQGLWVEVEVEKELKLRTKKDIENLVPGDKKASVAKFVEMCKERVHKFAGIQTEQSKRLGYFMDWDHSYFTMDEDNNYMIWRFLKVCYDNGWIYKGHESVPWCPRCETAISQHEMLTEDYKELVHESIFFRLPIEERDKEFLLVWTTTPWTIPANIAVAVDETISYVLVEQEDGNRYWLAKDLLESVFAKKYKRILKTVLGKELVGLRYKGPFDELPAVAEVAREYSRNFHTVVATDQNLLPITATEGTGLVHTAVSAGTEDFLLGKKLGLPMIPVINDDASYMTGFGTFSGKNAKKHPELVIDFLRVHQEGKFLLKTMMYKHRYPACWRCKTELVWKVADEWYVAMDKKAKKDTDSRSLRERMIDTAQKITWMPEFGLARELDWLKNMHDWLISKKNRYWGLALPIYVCSSCGSFEVMGSHDELKKRAISGWAQFEGHSPHKPFIDDVVIACSSCGKEAKRIPDVGNPWLDAGIVPFSTIKKGNVGKPLYQTDREEWKKWFPIDFITESFPGQFKNWFYSLIAMAAALESSHPFKRVLGYGTLFGEDGRAMHKSWGNSIEFNEGADKIGVDVMRWMYARANPAENMLFGYKKADEVRRQFYLMFWNVYKFFVDYVNLEKVDKTALTVTQQKPKNVLDLWMTERLRQFIILAETSLKGYNAKDLAAGAEELVKDVSTWFIRRSRDRVWVNSTNEEDKLSFYRTLYFVLVNLAIVLSPVLPFITDIVYTNLTGEESVHLSSWPEHIKQVTDTKLLDDMKLVREMVEAGHRVRKEAKLKVKQPLASAAFHLDKDRKFRSTALVEDYMSLIKGELNVKGVEIDYDGKPEIIQVVYDTTLTPELLKEGRLREILRQIQEQRKVLGVMPDEKVKVVIPLEFEEQTDIIKRKVLAAHMEVGPVLKVTRA